MVRQRYQQRDAFNCRGFEAEHTTCLMSAGRKDSTLDVAKAIVDYAS